MVVYSVGVLQSRAMDFGSREPVTCLEARIWEATVSGGYNHGPRILDFANHSLVWKLESGGLHFRGPTISGHEFWISRTIHLSGSSNLGGYSLGPRILHPANHSLVWEQESGGLQSRGATV